jgi:RHS repeat-associated protein
VTRYSSIQSGNNWNGRTYNVKNQPQDGVSLFDGNGNQTRSPRFTTISHDWEDRPTQFDLNGGVFKRSGYHVEGTRAWSSGTSSADTWYLYDGATPVAELDFSGNLVAINAFGPNGLICRRTATGGARFYLFDERGNTAQRLDNNGNLLASHVTDAYGATVAPQNALPSTDVDPFDGMGGQLGYYQDETTGLLLCTFRFYDPTQARWLTRDPIGYSGGVNLYGYVTGNPIMGADPLGLFTIGGFEFDREVFSSGIRTGLAATGSAFTGGIWDGGAERCKPGFGVSYGLAVIGREALAMAGMRALQFKMLASPRSHPTFVFQRGPGGNPWTALKTGTIYIPEYVWKMGGAALRRAISHETVHANISLSLPRNLRFLRQGITGGSVQWRVLEEHLARRVAGASRWQALRDMGFSNLGIDALRYWAPGWMDIARGSLEWYNWTH